MPDPRKPKPIVRTQRGAFCSACQSLLSIEEEDFETCDACGGEGLGGNDLDDGFYDPYETE